MNTRFSVWTVVTAALLAHQLSCAAWVSLRMDGPTPDEQVQLGMHRSQVETTLRKGSVSQFEVEELTEARYEYSDGPAGWSKIRALLYVGADVFTLFLSELIFWPTELYASDRIERVATARYDDASVLQQWTVRRANSAQVLRAESAPANVAAGPPQLESDRSQQTAASYPSLTNVVAVARNDSLHAGETRLSAPASAEGIDFGSYHALVIGNDTYAHLRSLRTATSDARAVAEVLAREYGFDVKLLIDGTRAETISSLYRYRSELNGSDNLLIYYAGHGWQDEDTGRGYWLPVDATRDDPANWISNATITDLLKANPAKHVMLVVDSCFSGTLTRGIKLPRQSNVHLEKLSAKKTRTALTSGGSEPVEDGAGEHSVFAAALLRSLLESQGVLEGQTLFTEIRRPVMLESRQTPEYGDVRFTGHEGGDFLFVRSSD